MVRELRRATLAAALSSILPAMGIAGDVLVVDPAASGAFSSIQAATLAANDGDTILVRYPGVSDRITGNGKTLTYVADPSPAGTWLDINQIHVSFLPATKTVTIRGFRVSPGAIPSSTASFSLTNNAGHVVLEDCSASFGQPYPKISLIANCSNVSLTRCGFYGVESASNTPALTGLAVTNSTVFLQDCSVSGGSGKYAFPSALPPAPALVVNGGRIHISGGMVIGGNGASIANDGSCINGGDGAPAVLLGVGSPFLTTLGNPLVGGSGGTVVSCGQAGVAGPLVQIDSGLFTPFQDQARSLKLASPARVGQFTTLTVSGVPGEAAFALVSPSVQAQFILALKGALIPAFPLTLVPLGTIPVGGTLTYPITIPSDLLPPGLEALNVHAQIHVAGALGSGIVGSSSVLTVVDSSF